MAILDILLSLVHGLAIGLAIGAIIAAGVVGYIWLADKAEERRHRKWMQEHGDDK